MKRKPKPPFTIEPSYMSVPILLPKESIEVLDRVAKLAGVNRQTVVQVMMAFEIERSIAAKVIKRRGPK